MASYNISVKSDWLGKAVFFLLNSLPILNFFFHFISHFLLSAKFCTQKQIPLFVLYFIIIIYSLEFFTSALADGLSLEFEWQQVSRTLLSILAVLNNAVVWMVSTLPLTSKFSSPF